MKSRDRIWRFFFLALVTSAVLSCLPAPALAQDAASMSCDELWYARNEIYARNGYCFQTARAQAAFPPPKSSCFPPYGKLQGWEQERVNELQTWERRKGC